MTYYEMRGKNRHSSKKLDSLLGKTVEVELTTGRRYKGVLGTSEYNFRYVVNCGGNTYAFAKTIVKSIKEVRLL